MIRDKNTNDLIDYSFQLLSLNLLGFRIFSAYSVIQLGGVLSLRTQRRIFYGFQIEFRSL